MKWLLSICISLPFTVLAITASPILALFVHADGYLPRWLRWFQTPDAPAIGDIQYRNSQMAGITSRWWIATCWLARNPAYGFDEMLGARISVGHWYQSSGDEETHNTPIHNGWCYRTVTNPDMSYFWQIHAVYAWSERFCIKIALGWKLWGKLKSGETRRLCCTINPFTKYTK